MRVGGCECLVEGLNERKFEGKIRHAHDTFLARCI
eukprot:COSAG04_NODE_10598_length_765_cov_1.385886_1_plen_34_part_01